jgi:hypothetical protein
MSNDLKDILSNSNKDIDNQQLMDYLSQQMSDDKKHDVEKSMAADPFLNDAIEGLQQIDDTKRMEAFATLLNKDLQKHIIKNKKQKNKRRWKDQPYTYIAIVVFLVLAVICFVVLKKKFQSNTIHPLPTTGKIVIVAGKQQL